MSTQAIRKRLLAELSAYGSGITAAGLLELVKANLSSTTLGDVVEELTWLRDFGLAAYTASELAPDDRALRQWTITTKGELMLKK